MSLPSSPEEEARLTLTLRAARGSENAVSTACPSCGTRFALLARFTLEHGWLLRCTLCAARFAGQLKELREQPREETGEAP